MNIINPRMKRRLQERNKRMEAARKAGRYAGDTRDAIHYVAQWECRGCGTLNTRKNCTHCGSKG